MGYVEDSLVPGEEILYKAKISLGIFVLSAIYLIIIWFLASFMWNFTPEMKGLIIILMFFLSLYVIIRLLLAYFTTEFALTNKRIIAKRGLIRRHSLEILLSKVESVSVSRPLTGLIFGFGTVTVIGSGGTNETFKSISNPMELRKQINTKIASF